MADSWSRKVNMTHRPVAEAKPRYPILGLRVSPGVNQMYRPDNRRSQGLGSSAAASDLETLLPRVGSLASGYQASDGVRSHSYLLADCYSLERSSVKEAAPDLSLDRRRAGCATSDCYFFAAFAAFFAAMRSLADCFRAMVLGCRRNFASQLLYPADPLRFFGVGLLAIFMFSMFSVILRITPLDLICRVLPLWKVSL